MCMDSQGENSIHNLPHITDFRLECCILKEDTKNNISGRSIWAGVWSESKPHFLNKLNYSPWDVHPNSAFEYTNSFRDDILSCSRKGNV